MEKTRRRRLRDGRLKAGDSLLLFGMMLVASASAWAHEIIPFLVQILCALVVVVVGLGTYEN